MINRREIAEVRKTGRLDGLKVREDELNPPLPGEVQIAIRSIGLNFADIFAIYGLYSATPNPPFVPGLEFAGDVVGIGEGVQGTKIGDRVMGATRFGAYATAINQKVDYIFPLPNDWSYEQGSAFPVQALTAYYALFALGNCNSNSTVLIHSGAGGVGLLANQMVKKVGGYSIGCVGSKEKIDFLYKQGFDGALVRDKNFKKNVNELLNGRSLDLVLECIGGKIFQESYDLLSPMGRLIAYGSANFTPNSNRLNAFNTVIKYILRPKLDPLKMISDNKSVMGFNLIWLWDQVNLLKGYMQDTMKMNLKPQEIGFSISWNELHKGLEKFRSGKTIGKVVIRI